MTETSLRERPKQLDAVFEGGGARGLVLNGAVRALEDAGFTLNRVIGTSAGAIAAALTAVGYTGAELETVSLEKTSSGQSRMTQFISEPGHFTAKQRRDSSLGRLLEDIKLPFVPRGIAAHIDDGLVRATLALPGLPYVFSFVEEGGLFSADGFVAWLSDQLEAKGDGYSKLTFAQLFAETGKHLSMVVTDTTAQTMRVLNHHTAPDCPVVWGVRMSMSIPFFWPEVIWSSEWGTYQGEDLSGHTFVDGGVLSNFPIHMLVSDDPEVRAIMGSDVTPAPHLIGLHIDADLPVPDAPPPETGVEQWLEEEHHQGKVTSRIARLVETVTSGNDQFVASAYRDRICRLPAGGYGVTEFNMSDARIRAILAAGYAAAARFVAQAPIIATPVT